MIKVIKEKKMSKRMNVVRNKISTIHEYSLQDALQLLKDLTSVKFNETIELIINLNIDTKHSDQMVRGIVNLPFGSGKVKKIAVICENPMHEELISCGADIIGSHDIIENIKKGVIDFDICISTPSMMPFLSSVAKILGPKGLMPNPKLGTVTTDVSSKIQSIQSGEIEFRADKSGIVHSGVGKMSFDTTKLVENVQTFLAIIKKLKPSAVRGNYIKSVYIKSTMSSSIKIALSSIL